MSKKNITMVLSSINRGGAEKMMINLANGFVNHNVDVELIVLKKKDSYTKRVDSRVNVKMLPQLPSIYLSVPFLIIYFLFKRPQRILSTQVHVNIVTILAVLPLFLRKKVIFREANTPSLSLTHSTNFKSRLTKVLALNLYPLVEKFVAISKGVKTDMAEFYAIDEKKIRVIWSPVITKEFSDLINEEVQNEEFNKNKVKLISVAHLSPQKNYKMLIDAYGKIANLIDGKLFILGKDTSKYALEMKAIVKKKELDDSIIFLGMVDNPYAYMSKADLLVLASKWEGFGNVLVEALACGCPIVSTDCPGGPGEILDYGKYGKLVPSGDTERLAEAILEKLQYPDDALKLKKRSEEFTLAVSLKKYIEYIYCENKN